MGKSARVNTGIIFLDQICILNSFCASVIIRIVRCISVIC